MKSREVEAVDLRRQVEVERLDALQASMWDKAVAGDVRAVTAIRQIIATRARLLGLLDPVDIFKESRRLPTTVVVPPDQVHQYDLA